MKEAFWGILVVVLGLFAVVAVNLFSEVTVDNDRSYYILKESTEGAMYDSLDLGYYRLHGVYRIVEEKFIESVTSRFTNNMDKDNYNIIVKDVNELPPKVSLYLKSGVTSLQNENFSIINGIDAIIEAKYPIGTVVNFLKISEEEYKELANKEVTKDNYCVEDKFVGEIECIDGEVQIEGWSDPKIKGTNTYLKELVCDNEGIPEATSKLTYNVCECGKWNKVTTEEITGTVKHTSSENTYTFTFTHSEGHTISDTFTFIQKIDVCTKSIGILVPYNWNTLKPTSDGKYYSSTSTSYYEPSLENDSTYINCPSGGIEIPVYRDTEGAFYTSYALHASYNPTNAINRGVDWSVNNNYLTINTYNPNNNCSKLYLNESGTNCISKGIITTTSAAWEAVKGGNKVTTTVTAKSLPERGIKAATCNVTLYNGYATPTCESLTIKTKTAEQMISNFSATNNLLNANFTNLKWSSSNESIISIDQDTGVIYAAKDGTVTITVSTMKKDGSIYASGTCTVTSKSSGTVDPSPTPSTPANTYYGEIQYDYIRSYENGKEVIYKVQSGIKSYDAVDKNNYTIIDKVDADSDIGKAYVKEATAIHGYTSAIPQQVGTTVTSTVGKYTLETTIAADGTKTVVTKDSSGKEMSTIVEKSDNSYSYPCGKAGNASCPSSSSGGGGGGGGGSCYPYCPLVNSCFEAGTKIQTLNGYKNIEDIKKGDIVLSYNYVTKTNEYKSVTDTFIHNDVYKEMYEITINNNVIKTTWNHKFYVKDNITVCTDKDYLSESGYVWKEARDLKVGDYVKTSTGDGYYISSVNKYYSDVTVYNFTVLDNNNYYVSETNVLVHNKYSYTVRCFVAGTKVSTIDGYKNIEDIKIGDVVLSYNYITKENEYKTVDKTFEHINVTEEMISITINNEVIKATGNHKFYVKTNEIICTDKDYLSESGYVWKEASNLKIGDLIKSSEGIDYQITNIVSTYENITVYNIKVDDNHNYYVGYSSLLSHNKI